MAFINDMSKSLFRSFQQMCDLNIQLAQTMLEETTLASQQVLTADRQTEALSAAASRAQPTTEKLRAYQQHISRVAADAQVELSRVAEQHVQNTTRTARALADEVSRVASEETERGMRTQQENIRKFADPFTQAGNGSAGPAQKRGDGGSGAGASMQSSTQHGMSQGSSQGTPGSSGTPAASGTSASSGSSSAGTQQSSKAGGSPTH